jgi:hypothetical protein
MSLVKVEDAEKAGQIPLNENITKQKQLRLKRYIIKAIQLTLPP